MQNVTSAAIIAAVSLLVAQAALVVVRTPSCVRRHVPLLLVAALLLCALHAAASTGSAAAELSLVAVQWACGSFLLLASRRKGFKGWTGASAAVLLTLLIGRALGHEDSIQYQALSAFSCTALASILLGTTWSLWREGQSPAALAAFAAGCCWILIGGAELAARTLTHGSIPLQGLPELAFSLCSGWLVFQDGFPARPSWRGSLPGLAARAGLLESMYARLFDAESALAAQEQVTAAGFLALGAAHEFKNTLSMVKLAAHHGLVKPEAGVKDACLRQIVEHTMTARDSAMEVLERLTSNEAVTPQKLDAKRDLTASIRRAGAALRGHGIVINLDLDCGMMFFARRSDVEQILLNLIRNAADGYRLRPSEASQPIAITARADDESVVIEIRDHAGGVAEEMRSRLFKPSASGTGSSGLGLYLSRNLALANGGSLDYVPTEDGSLFRLSLPAVE